MHPIITQPAQAAHLDAAALRRADRLAKATVDQMQDALAFLSMIDPDAFDIAFTAVIPVGADDQPETEGAVPVCRTCGAQVGIFPEQGLDWRHYRGDGVTSGAQVIYDLSHAPEVTWCLPDENPQEL